MKPSTRLLLNAASAALNFSALVLTGLTHNWLMFGICAAFLLFNIVVVLNLGKELDSFYQAYKDEKEEDDEEEN